MAFVQSVGFDPAADGLGDFLLRLRNRASLFFFRSAQVGEPGVSIAKGHTVRHVDFETTLNLIFESLPDPDEVLRKAGLNAGVAYRELLVDAHVAGAIMQRKSRNKLAEIIWLPGKMPDSSIPATAEGAKTMVETQWNNIKRKRNVINEILMAPFFGATYLDMFWNFLPTGDERPAGEIILTDIIGKPFEWFGYDKDNHLGIKSTVISQDFRILPIAENKILPIVNDGTYQNPYGDRSAKRVFWPTQFKKGGFRFWTEFVEKFGMPFLHGRMDSRKSDDDLNAFHDILVDMVRNGVVVSKDDAQGSDKIDVVADSGRAQGSQVQKEFKDAMNIEISKGILGETLTIENSESGSQAATKFHVEMLRDIQDDDKLMTEDALNRLSRLITDLNFGKEVPSPKAKFVNPKDIGKDIAERDSILVDKVGVRFKKQYISKTYKIDEDDFEIREPITTEPTGGVTPPAGGASGGTGHLNQEDEDKKKEPAEFQEGFKIQNALDSFLESRLTVIDGLSVPVRQSIMKAVRASEDYSAFFANVLTVADALDHGKMEVVAQEVFNYFELVGTDAADRNIV